VPRQPTTVATAVTYTCPASVAARNEAWSRPSDAERRALVVGLGEVGVGGRGEGGHES